MQRYSSYKDSGVKWLGEIPSHWETIKSKYIWQEQFATSENGTEELLSVSQYDGVTPSKGDSRSESLKGYKIVKENDLVINIMLAWLGGLGVSKHNGIVSPAYCTYKMTGGANPHFLHYLYKTPLYLSEFARHSTGVVPSRWRMYTDDFGQVLTLLPPKSEQDAIVSYLDTVTSKIDAAIAQQQKMIELLNERKQIIINNAVTKGLDPNVKMKDSGVEWIGEIPEGWEVRKLKHVTSKIGSGSTPRGGADVYTDYGVRFLRSQNVYNDGLRLSDVAYIADNVHVKMKGTQVRENDILYNITGGSIGRCCCYTDDKEANVNQHVSIVRPFGIVPKFLMFSLQSSNAQRQLRITLKGGNREGLAAESFKEFLIVVPTLNDQNKIVADIESKFVTINNAIDATNNQITLLQERKQIIINEVVTGKVKVS
ncbi:MAG: restriction endonuclease subunit S [Paludibacteraceae bacterium]|nr:restriction endonuclease subunit S [Paludibacteraceae bacterium]